MCADSKSASSRVRGERIAQQEERSDNEICKKNGADFRVISAVRVCGMLLPQPDSLSFSSTLPLVFPLAFSSKTCGLLHVLQNPPMFPRKAPTSKGLVEIVRTERRIKRKQGARGGSRCVWNFQIRVGAGGENVKIMRCRRRSTRSSGFAVHNISACTDASSVRACDLRLWAPSVDISTV